MFNGKLIFRSRVVLIFTLCIIFIMLSSSCSKPYAVGDIVDSAPVTTLVFETDSSGGGVVYRKINDASLLIAQEDNPVLVIFFDGRAISNSAIPFTEQLCDRFAETLRIIRVNVDVGGVNSTDADELINMFEVKSYPWFALSYKGQRKSAFAGYKLSSEKDIIDMILSVDN